MFKNTADEYGWLSKALHWATALFVVGLFALGFWMVELDYYSDWYQVAPFYHESFGILLILLLAIRAYWTLTNRQHLYQHILNLKNRRPKLSNISCGD